MPILNQADSANNLAIHDLRTLQERLGQLIPISAHMGIEPISYDGQKLTVTAPLGANVNHQLSAFGGSLFSVAALAGWSILQIKLGEMELAANTVIAGGDVGYALPVFEEIVCEVELPEEYLPFTEKLKSTGRASLALTSKIFVGADKSSAMTFNGKYVVKAV